MAYISIPQFDNEPFWVYFNRLEDFLDGVKGLTKGDYCEIINLGLNENFRGVVDNMLNGKFQDMSSDEAWDFYSWLARDNYDWERANHETYVRDSHAFNVDANCHDLSNMNSHDVLDAPHSDHVMHDFNSLPSIAQCNEVHSNDDEVHALSHIASDFCMNSKGVPHSPLDDSNEQAFDSSIHDDLDSFEIMAQIFLEFQTVAHNLMSKFIDKASLERDEFERNLPPFTLDFEIVEGKAVYCGEKEDKVDYLGVFELEGDVEHEGSSFEDSMIDFHSLISDVRSCDEGLATPFSLSHTPFSQRFNHISYYPMFLPSFLKEPLRDPLPFQASKAPNPFIVDEEKSYNANQKDFCEDFSFSSSTFSSYFLDFSFGTFTFSFLPSLKHKVSLYFMFACHMSIAYALFLDMFAGAYDKLLRSLSGYLLDWSRLDVKQAFAGSNPCFIAFIFFCF